MPETSLTRRGMLAGSGALALASCAPSGKARPVVIGYQKNGLLLLGHARGTMDKVLAEAGFPAAQWVLFPSGPPMLEAMASGAVDVGAVGESPAIFAQSAGHPVYYVAAEPVTGKSSAILVPTASPIRTVAQLKGRKVGFTRASSAHLVLAKALQQAGLTFADITPINLPPPDAAGALAAGAIDAWSTWDPYYALQEAAGTARAIVTADQLPPSDAFFIATPQAVKGKALAVRAVIAGLRATADWTRTHLDEAIALSARLTGLDPGVTHTMLRRGDYTVGPVTDAVLRRQQANADLFAQLGVIPARVDIGQVVWRDGFAAG